MFSFVHPIFLNDCLSIAKRGDQYILIDYKTIDGMGIFQLTEFTM